MAIEQSLPDAVGAFVDWLIHESGWMVTERRGSDAVSVKVEARHVCILFRRFVSYTTDMTRAYLDALEARGIKHLLVGGRAFHNREEIETLRAALAAIEWPDDELSVFATLRGALFAIGDEDLLDYHHRFGRSFNPFKVPDALPDHLAPVGDALRLLARLHNGRNHVPVADTITRMLDETRAHVGFALRRAGEQVLANVLHVAELARQYDLSGGISFRGFVDDLREAAEQSQAAEAPIVEEGSDGVRLMTVHKAKGLEFPVVVLADITANLAPAEASRHLDAPSALCALRIGGWSPRDLLLTTSRSDSCARTRGRDSASRMSPPPAPAICLSCRPSATNRTIAGSARSTARSIRRLRPFAINTPRPDAPPSAKTRSFGARTMNCAREHRMSQASITSMAKRRRPHTTLSGGIPRRYGLAPSRLSGSGGRN